MPIDDYLATAPEHERPIAELLAAHVGALPEAVVEPVSVGLLFKRRSTFAQSRTMTRWVALGITLPRVVGEPTPSRKVQSYPGGHHHVWNLRTAADLDDRLFDLLDEAYEANV
ncbi:hypothetical protein BH11ACT8_BH11ACT8_11350 [soil metagenome]